MAITLRKSGLATELFGVDQNEANAKKAIDLNLIDHVLPVHDVLPQSDLVLISIPVNATAALLPSVLENVNEQAVVIDVGTTRVPSTETKSGFRLKGDVKFDEVAPKCSYITPVPGGVGPMSIVSLLKNTLLAAKGEIYS